jgi:hypothetical protein
MLCPRVYDVFHYVRFLFFVESASLPACSTG